MKERNQEPLNAVGNFELPVAREVLNLCRISFDEYKRDQPTGDKWKLHYFLILSLLRTVGEGLNVDKDNAKLHPNMAREIKNFFKYIKDKNKDPETEIYWHFIREETNTLLHKFASTQGAGQSSDSQGNRLYTIVHGPFKGRDQRCVIEQAICWWKAQLEDIIYKAGAG